METGSQGLSATPGIFATLASLLPQASSTFDRVGVWREPPWATSTFASFASFCGHKAVGGDSLAAGPMIHAMWTVIRDWLVVASVPVFPLAIVTIGMSH